jgi:hypothetical protein
LAREHGQPVHRGPDGVLDAVAALPPEYAGIDQLVECGAVAGQLEPGGDQAVADGAARTPPPLRDSLVLHLC